MIKYLLNGVNYIESHETCPIVGVATSFGDVFVLEIDDQGNVDVIANYCLTSSKIVYMKFLPNSMSLVVIDDQSGFFLIKTDSKNNSDIKKFIRLNRKYLDYSSVKTNGTLHELLLYTKDGSNLTESSNSVCDYLTIEENLNYSHQMQTIQLNCFYSALQFQYYDSNKFVLGAKMTEIDLFLLNCGENGKIELSVQQTIATTHSFGTIQFTVNASSVLTYASDGQIILWDKNSMRVVKSVVAHGVKFSHGVKNAVFDPLQRCVRVYDHITFLSKLLAISEFYLQFKVFGDTWLE